MLCGVICGPRSERWWQGAGEPADFFDAKGVDAGGFPGWKFIDPRRFQFVALMLGALLPDIYTE